MNDWEIETREGKGRIHKVDTAGDVAEGQLSLVSLAYQDYVCRDVVEGGTKIGKASCKRNMMYC
jgi:hypothetical protein